jgi:hypothetical protein
VTVLFLSLEIVMFTFEEQHVIIQFLHLCGIKPIEIHQQLSETCNDGVMDMKNVRSWVRQFTEGRASCEDKPKDPPPRTRRYEDMNARVEQMAMFWNSEGVILTHWVPKGSTVTGETYEDVLRAKFLPAMREQGPKKMQLCFFITKMLLPIGRLVFTSFSKTTALKLFLMLRTHLTSCHW